MNYPRYINRLFLCVLIFLLASCANRSKGPQGGPKDVTPPHAVKSHPSNGQLNSKAKDLEIDFSEFITLDKPQEKIIVSPPQINPATIRSSGKKVLITLNDSLKRNTTYSIDFTNSIVDLNEHNPLKGYTYCFSTGNEIDSLQISGIVLDAQNLNPLSNLIVGIYDNLNDTAFVKTAPLRVGRTDEAGKFCIKNVKAGVYNVFALNDLNHDFTYNDPNEQMAFLDAPVTPHAESILVTDTIKADTLKKEVVKKDSIRQVRQTIFYPNDIQLKAFKEKFAKQYFIKAERKDKYRMSFFFNAPNKKMPVLKPLNYTEKEKGFFVISEKVDTINYWIADSTVYQMDSLKVSLEYEKTDSVGKLFNKIDTLTLAYKKIIVSEKKRNSKSKAPLKQFLSVKNNILSVFDIYKPILFTFDTPILSADEKKIHLSVKKDTIWTELPVKLQKLDSLGFKYGITNKWNSDLEYKLGIDSTAFCNRYGLQCDKSSVTFKIKPLDQYSNLIVTLVNFNDKAIIQLLDEKDAVVKQLPAKQQGTVFEYLTPGDYYLRLFIDTNNNGLWDAGKYADKKQAEQVYYLNEKVSLRANWDVEQEWDYAALPLQVQKPKVLMAVKDKK